MDSNKEQDLKEFNQDSKQSGRFKETILPHILKLYSSATPADFEIYAPNASFEDPFMCAHGVKEIKSAFYGVPKICSESKITEYNIEENATGPNSSEILIDNKQYYKVFGRDLILTSLIKLYIDDGKIIRHEDWWNKKPLVNRNSARVALLGRCAEMMRRCSMFVTHAMMGFGKDPHP